MILNKKKKIIDCLSENLPNIITTNDGNYHIQGDEYFSPSHMSKSVLKESGYMLTAKNYEKVILAYINVWDDTTYGIKWTMIFTSEGFAVKEFEYKTGLLKKHPATTAKFYRYGEQFILPEEDKNIDCSALSTLVKKLCDIVN